MHGFLVAGEQRIVIPYYDAGFWSEFVYARAKVSKEREFGS